VPSTAICIRLSMQPIHELLARIRWDERLSRSQFDIGYWDRVVRATLRVSLGQISWNTDNPSLFEIVDTDGVGHSIPFHRVRKVWRDGVLIWDRDRRLRH